MVKKKPLADCWLFSPDDLDNADKLFEHGRRLGCDSIDVAWTPEKEHHAFTRKVWLDKGVLIVGKTRR